MNKIKGEMFSFIYGSKEEGGREEERERERKGIKWESHKSRRETNRGG